MWKLKKELDSMEKTSNKEGWWTYRMGQFDGCGGETQWWVENLFGSKRPKQKDLKEYYKLPTLEEIVSRLNRAKVFTKTDANKG